MKLLVVSGLSGSGKSVALNTLEDLGYYCIDNLPLALVGELAWQLREDDSETEQRYAVGIDARNSPENLARFPELLEQLEDDGIEAEIIFLKADVDTLIKRFSETRRKHPLTGRSGVPLAEAIQKELALLAPVLEHADLVIDTTSTTLHDLRAIISNRLDRRDKRGLSILFQSFGFKHGLPKDADFVFDVRCLPNPHWEPSLRPLTGRDEPVAAYLSGFKDVTVMINYIRDFFVRWIPEMDKSNRSYLTIAIGCTGGQHRSVYIAEQLAAHFQAYLDNVVVRHRELP